MDNNKWDNILNRLQAIFSSKRMKLTLYVAVVLWVAVLAQITVNQMFHEDIQITEAFIKSKTENMESTLEIIAEYKTGDMTDTDKMNIINTIAAVIGLKIDNNYTSWFDEDRSELLVYKQAKQASTQIKIVSIKEDEILKNFIIVQIRLSKGIENIDHYKQLVEEELGKLNVIDEQVILKYEGSREGELTLEEKRTLATTLIAELQGNVALEYNDGDLYTVYGYTGMLKEYISSMGNKINVQVAITYNEMNDSTKIVLATPILNDSY